jgi:hypothetical protein
VLGALAALAPSACGGVLVPVDPPARTAETVAAGGDVIVFNREQKSFALVDGKAVRVPGASATTAVADDGTAVIASRTGKGVAAQVRRGGTFAPPVRVGGKARFVRAAAARGGWVAVAWTDAKVDDIQLAVIDPQGALTYQVLERANGDRLSMPGVGIDASGRTTVAWSRWRDVRDSEHTGPQQVRVARGNAAATTVASGAAPLYEQPTWPLVALAVSPSGHSLLAWSTSKQVQISEDGGPPRTVASAGRPSSPTAALADDGAALVAYSDIDADRLPVLAVERSADGAWTQPQRLSGSFITVVGHATVGNDEDVELSSALAEDGRAAVGWVALGDVLKGKTSPAVLATRAIAGRWAPARAISPPTATVQWTPALFLDASGAPRALWAETELLGPVGVVHGVRLVSEAQAPPADTVPPRLSATLPSSVRLGTVRIPVRCSEDCQVQAQLWDHPSHRADALTELRSGRASMLKLTPRDDILVDWETSPARTLHLRLRASDRAGNVSTLTRIVRVTGGDSPS